MDFFKLLSRRKSIKKQEKNSVVNESRCRPTTDDQFDAVNDNTEPVPERGLQKVPKGWRKSFHKIRRRSKFTSSSCDDILEKNHIKTEDEVEIPISAYSKMANRWSYSPGNTVGVETSVDLGTFTQRRNTEGLISMQSESSSHDMLKSTLSDPSSGYAAAEDTFSGSAYAMATSSDETATKSISLKKSQSEQALPANCTSVSLHSNSLTNSYERLSRPVSAVAELPPAWQNGLVNNRGRVRAPHSTLFEHEAETALDHMDDCEQEEKEPSDDNTSWGTNEFDSDSDEMNDEVPDHVKSKAEPDSSNSSSRGFPFRKKRDLTKDLSKGVRNLFDRKSVHKPISKDDDISLFVEYRISTDRHPGPQLQPPSGELEPYQLRRRKIVETIIQSECSYIDSLQRLEINYKKALLDYKPLIISIDAVEKIFYKVADILQCHQLFQIALAAAVSDWDSHEKIGDTFVASFSKSMVLECYSKYINNFSVAMELVQKTCKQKPQFLSFLRDRQNESQDRLNLYGLMLKVVQRFPQFIMLVQDLLKHTPSGHGDRLPLQLALTEMETLAENLNRRRADSEEKSEMLRLLDLSNIKLLSNETKDGRTRRMLKKDFVRERSYTSEGTIEKDKKCLLVLTNDMLMCCSLTSRRQEVRSGISAFKDMYKLKWFTELDVLRVQDDRSSAIKDYLKMKDDRTVLQTIQQQAEYLHFAYAGISPQQIEDSLSALEAKIRQAEQVTQYESDTSFTATFPQKSGEFRRTLIISDAVQCNEWLERIFNAKLSNGPENLHCWHNADGSDSETLWTPPLFMGSMKCSTGKAQQMQCAYAFMPEAHVTLLWLACSATTVLAVVNVFQIVQDSREKVHVMQVESSVQCMEHWNPCGNAPSVWLGMECGSLIEFSAESSYAKLCEVTMPTMSTVMIMKGFERNLYVSLLDGSLLLYTRPEGSKGLTHVKTLNVGNGSLTCLSVRDEKLWGTCGNDVITVKRDGFVIESIRTVPTETQLTVSHMVQVGSGFWVAFCDTCDLHLYHLETLKLLQNVNLSRTIRDFFQALGWQSRIGESSFVTALWSSFWQLFVGMSNGLIMTMPLPKLPDSIPRITGPCRICYHMLSGPVRFLCAPEPPTILPTVEDESTDLTPEEADPPEIPERSPIKPPVVSDRHKLKHKRTSSEGLIYEYDNGFVRQSASRSMREKRLSSIEPYNKNNSNYAEIEEDPRPPPPLPPKPNDGSQKGQFIQVACEELFENDFVFPASSIDTSPSPSRTIQWKARKHRDLPVLLACGEGYRYTGEGKDVEAYGIHERATTFLCWKVVL